MYWYYTCNLSFCRLCYLILNTFLVLLVCDSLKIPFGCSTLNGVYYDPYESCLSTRLKS